MFKQIYSINLLFALIRPAVREIDQELHFRVNQMRIQFKDAVKNDSLEALNLVEMELCEIAQSLLTPKYKQIELDYHKQQRAKLTKAKLVKALWKAIKWEPIIIKVNIGVKH